MTRHGRSLRPCVISRCPARRRYGCKVSLQPTQLAAFCADLESEAQRRHAPVRLLARAGNGILYAAFEGKAVPDDQILSLVDWIRVHAPPPIPPPIGGG